MAISPPMTSAKLVTEVQSMFTVINEGVKGTGTHWGVIITSSKTTAAKASKTTAAKEGVFASLKCLKCSIDIHDLTTFMATGPRHDQHYWFCSDHGVEFMRHTWQLRTLALAEGSDFIALFKEATAPTQRVKAVLDRYPIVQEAKRQAITWCYIGYLKRDF